MVDAKVTRWHAYELQEAENRRKGERALRKLRAGGANADLTKDGATSGRTGNDKRSTTATNVTGKMGKAVENT